VKIIRSFAAPLIVAVLATASGASTSSAGDSAPTLQQLIGQKLVVRMDRKTPSASLLTRIRTGQVGGVIIHRDNFDSAAGLHAITSTLQQASAAGGQPPLLIGVDQEGGPVKTVPWIPPTLSPRQMGALGSGRTALTQGQSTGEALLNLGVNADFAPVDDVPTSTASFLYRQGRTWSFRVHTTAGLTGWFALGLGRRGELATAKHFPGLGMATRNTDQSFVRITATKAELEPGLRPFKTAVADRVPLIMLSNAVYPAYDSGNAAGWSRAIGTTLLRGELGFHGVTITDSLDGAAHARGTAAAALAVRAASAGTDLLLLTASEQGSRAVYSALLRSAASGRLSRTTLLASYRRVLALKTTLRTGG
jgi:beta-N-acetylhexosaminidase